MSKYTDALKAALERKQSAAHPDSKSGSDKNKTKNAAGVVSNKPARKTAGRGR